MPTPRAVLGPARGWTTVLVRLAFFPDASTEQFAQLSEVTGRTEPERRVLFAAGPVEGGGQVAQAQRSRADLEDFNRLVLFRPTRGWVARRSRPHRG